jgi:hypothetical protein
MDMWMRKGERLARSRPVLLARIETLVRRGSPRLMMTGIVVATSVAGVLASLLLRRGGLSSMWLRYGLSVAFAYFSFMFFLWLWILAKSRGRHRDPVADADDGGEDDFVTISVNADPPGAASGDASRERKVIQSGSRSGSGSGSGMRLDGSGGDIDLEGIVAVVVVIAIVGAAAASVYLIAIAPEFLAELLLDGVFATIVLGRFRAVDRRHWFQSALSRTWFAALGVAVVFMIAGAVCQWYAPEASTLGGVWQHWLAKVRGAP